MKSKTKKILALLLINFSLLAVQNVEAKINRITLVDKKTTVNFEAVGNPGFIGIEGTMPFTSGELKLNGTKFEGTVLLDLTKVETGIDLRDSHLREKYLEIKKFPQAKLEITGLNSGDLSFLEDSAEKKFTLNLSGILELHGVKKNLEIPLKGKKNADGSIEGNSEFEINLKDFGIEIPSYSGITVAEKVIVKAKFEGKAYSDQPIK